MSAASKNSKSNVKKKTSPAKNISVKKAVVKSKTNINNCQNEGFIKNESSGILPNNNFYHTI